MAQGFPDVEDALCEILQPLGATGTSVDEDFAIPIRVNRTGGSTSGIQDSAFVEVTAFCETRAESAALNRLIVAALNDRRAIHTVAGFIDKITSFTSPIPLPDLNPDVRQVTSTWAVTSRLQELPA